jgi:hypothetical protein
MLFFVDRPGLIGVSRMIHLLLLTSGRNAAKNPNTRPMEMKAISATKQLLSRHHGRKDHVTETSLNAGQVDAQTQSPKMSAAATSPAIKPTTKPFLKFGYIASIRLTGIRPNRGLA